MAKRKSPDDHREQPLPPKRQRQDQEAPPKGALDKLPKATRTLSDIPPYARIHVRESDPKPPLPVVNDEELAATPFRHVSIAKNSPSYDRLEFLGDSYIELFASRLLFARFATGTSPKQFNPVLQIREALVSNETLSGIARYYKFEEKLQMHDREAVYADTHKSNKGNKGMNKILADCVEAYTAAIILDDIKGFDTAERWLAALWEPKVAEMAYKFNLRSSYQYSLAGGSYHERSLEFLGGPYVDLFATRIIFARLDTLPPGRMSQIVERLVKNDTLGTLACQVGLAGASRKEPGKERDDATVFKAHVASRILHDHTWIADGEQWCLRLWADRLLEEINHDPVLAAITVDPSKGPIDLRSVYNPQAKVLIQKRIGGTPTAKLLYETYKDSIELKGAQLGQSRHFIAVYFTGFGHDKKLLGKGEGKSKAEAGNWAAIDAMYGESKGIVDECEGKRRIEKEQRAAEAMEKEQQNAKASLTEGTQSGTAK